MHLAAVLTLAMQATCLIHLFRTGRDRYWVWLILFVPALGALIYFLMEMVPDLRTSFTARRAARNVVGVVDPRRGLRQRVREFDISDNVENTIKLADVCIEAGRYDQAIELYDRARSGIFSDDPAVLLGAARTYLHGEQFTRAHDAREVL